MTDNTETLPPLPQRWTTGDASTSEAGGFVAYSDYLELRRAALAQRQQVPGGCELTDEQAATTYFQGNSVSHIKSKATVYGDAVMKV